MSANTYIYRNQLTTLKVCVIIPTYNNSQTIARVVKDVLAFTSEVIVVNDGSTDATTEILKSFPDVVVLSYSPNKGKGIALRTGLKYAADKGYRYAITIDSDGQHFADDIPVFLRRIEQDPDSLIIGARNLNQENMPGKNTFGNKFSNFWFRFQTGIALPDTQSGFRLYPVQRIRNTRYFTSKYEFEIEVMVKAAWQGIKVVSVPIKVYYAEKEKRITHFRPFKDFFRISLLNTWLTFLALLWYKPMRFLKNFNRGNIKKFFQKHFLDSSESIPKKSTAVGFGVFMGIVPIWGYQLVSALILAHLLKLNKAIVGVAANISVPPMIPFLLYGSLKTGQLVLGRDLSNTIFDTGLTLEIMKQHLFEYIIGSMVFALVMALLLGLITYIILKIIGKKVLVKVNE